MTPVFGASTWLWTSPFRSSDVELLKNIAGLGGVERVTGGGGVAVELVHLTDVHRSGEILRIAILVRSLGLGNACLGVDVLGEGVIPRRVAVGGGAEDVEVRGGAEAPGVVGGVLEELQLAAVRLEAEETGGETVLLASDSSLESGITDGGVDPVVMAVAEVGDTGMGVTGVEAGEENLADIRLVVAVGVLEEKHVGTVGDDQSAVGEDRGGRDGELVGEEGELVRLAVVVGILADVDAVVTEVAGLEVVRIVHGFHHIGAAAVVPRDVDRVDDVRLAGEEREFETVWHLGELHGIRRVERLLPLFDGLALTISGKDHLLLLQFRQLHRGELGADLGTDAPEDGAAEEFMEGGLVPAAHVMTVGGVEHLALALVADPGPRLLVAELEDGAVVGQAVVDVGFIPGFETRVTAHDRMLRSDDGGGEDPGLVRLEAATHQLDEGVRSAEAGGSAMDR